MTTERIDVLARAICETYARNSGNNFKDHFDTRAAVYWMAQALDEVGVAELIEADHEYEAARRDWDHVTAHDPEETSDETWRQVADRYEAAVMRRAAALARVGGE